MHLELTAGSSDIDDDGWRECVVGGVIGSNVRRRRVVDGNMDEVDEEHFKTLALLRDVGSRGSPRFLTYTDPSNGTGVVDPGTAENGTAAPATTPAATPTPFEGTENSFNGIGIDSTEARFVQTSCEPQLSGHSCVGDFCAEECNEDCLCIRHPDGWESFLDDSSMQYIGGNPYCGVGLTKSRNIDCVIGFAASESPLMYERKLEGLVLNEDRGSMPIYQAWKAVMYRSRIWCSDLGIFFYCSVLDVC